MIIGIKKYLLGVILLLIVIITSFIMVNNLKSINAEDGKDEYLGYEVTKDNINIPVLCYHSISDKEIDGNAVIITEERFRSHMKTIHSLGYKTLTIEELKEYLIDNKEIPVKSVLITFDDGYKDTYSTALNILKEYNMVATVFIIGDKVDKDGYMSKEDINEWINSGCSVGSHTLTHRNLDELSYEKQESEFIKSKDILENIINNKVISIAYPIGANNKETEKVFNKGDYLLGFATTRGYICRDSKIGKLNRFLVDYTYDSKDIKNILENAN